MKCKICKANSVSIFKTLILREHNVEYFQCLHCDFIQTETPYWLEQAYQSPMSILDVGVINRNIKCADLTQEAIEVWFEVDGSFLDYAGGYGILVRLMRDKGYNFVRSDKYSENLFASCFDINDSNHTSFEMITGFEVMEHLENPIEVLDDIFSRTKNFLFSTELIPFKNVSPENWWYFAPEGG